MQPDPMLLYKWAENIITWQQKRDICPYFLIYNKPSGVEDNEDDMDYEEVLSGFMDFF